MRLVQQQAHLLLSEMMHFVQQLQLYINFEVFATYKHFKFPYYLYSVRILLQYNNVQIQYSMFVLDPAGTRVLLAGSSI